MQLIDVMSIISVYNMLMIIQLRVVITIIILLYIAFKHVFFFKEKKFELTSGLS